MTNALSIYENGQFDLMQRTAAAMSASGFFQDARQQAQAIVKVMAGAELGISPFQAMGGIHIIKGRPAVSANLMAVLVRRHPRYDYDIVKHDDAICVIRFYKDGEASGESSFTIEDAKRAGTQNTNKFARNMLFARAMSNGVKWYAPDALGGAPVYTPDEFGMETDDNGNIIDVTPVSVTVETETVTGGVVEEKPQAPQKPTKFSDDFLQYCADNIDRYDNIHAVKAAFEKNKIQPPADKREARKAFDTLKVYADKRDAEDAAKATETTPPDGDQNTDDANSKARAELLAYMKSAHFDSPHASHDQLLTQIWPDGIRADIASEYRRALSVYTTGETNKSHAAGIKAAQNHIANEIAKLAQGELF